MYDSGASPGFDRGGGQEFFFPDLGIFAVLGGFGGMLPREFFLKWCNLLRFGVYFDQILSLKFFKNYHFLKITIFYIKILNIAIFFI